MAEAIDLIIVFALRKSEKLGFELSKEWRYPGKQHQPCFELGLMHEQTALLIPLDGYRSHAVDIALFKFLSQSDPG